jgi:hypothetical protein
LVSPLARPSAIIFAYVSLLLIIKFY